MVAARSFAKNTNNPVARIIDKGFQRIGKPIENIEDSMDNVGSWKCIILKKTLAFFPLFQGSANFWFCGNPDRFDAVVCQYSKSE